jgi:hypothetical protein
MRSLLGDFRVGSERKTRNKKTRQKPGIREGGPEIGKALARTERDCICNPESNVWRFKTLAAAAKEILLSNRPPVNGITL